LRRIGNGWSKTRLQSHLRSKNPEGLKVKPVCSVGMTGQSLKRRRSRATSENVC
jgi:hypothetical protein